MAHGDSAGMTIRDYLNLLRRHLVLVLLIPVLAAVGAYFYSSSQVQMYAASAYLLYQPAINPLSTSAYVDPNAQELQVQAATAVITGLDVAKRVASAQGAHRLPSFSVQASATAPDQAGAGTSYSTGVAVEVSSPDPQGAARLANAYATTFISWRAETQRAALTAGANAVDDQLRQFITPQQKASSEYVVLQERLRELELRAATATGDFVVVVPATVPTSPYEPNPARSAVMAFGVGLFVAMGAAFLREKLDTRLRTSSEVGELLDLPVVGRIPMVEDGALAGGHLVIVDHRDSHFADAFRLLVTNLEFASMGGERRVLMFTSALQGEGKSVSIANLAASLALAGHRVLLVDADLRRPQLHRLFGLRNVTGVSSIIAGKATPDDAMQVFEPAGQAAARIRTGAAKVAAGREGSPSSLWVLTAGPLPPNPGEMVTSQRFAALMERLRSMPYDYIFVDSPAFLAVGDSAALAGFADALVPLVNLRMSRRPILEEFRDRLGSVPVLKLGVIIVGEKAVGARYYRYYESGSPV